MVPNPISDDYLDAFLADERFTRTFESPALRISYADFGYRNEVQPELENVFLFFGPLLGSRMMLTAKDTVAKAYKVRIIVADRPGFGKTTPNIAPEKRIKEWRGAILALLQHLQIQHVFVGAQSAGAVYALDFILHHPEFLHTKGYLGLAAPWIHPSHSGIWQMSMLQALPQSLLAYTDKITSYFTIVSAPVINKGLDLVDSLLGWWQSTQTQQQQEQQQQQQRQQHQQHQQHQQQQTDEDKEFEANVAFAEALDPKLGAFMFADSVVGISNDAILLLQRPNDGDADGHGHGSNSISGWADWGDYDVLIPRLRQALADHSRRLVVDAFFSETDSMTGTPGTPGPDWFIDCWKTPAAATAAAAADDPISFSYRVVPETDHNSILSTRAGAARVMFEHIQSLVSSDT